MWSEAHTRRGALAALGALWWLSACGFSPAYAPGGAAAALRGQVLPDPPGGRFAFHFVAAFEDRLGRAGEDAPFRLGYALPLRTTRTALTGGGGALRLALEGTARYTLRDARGGVLASGRVSAFATYSDIGTSVAVRAARADAERRLAAMLAERVATRLVATAADWRPDAAR